MSRFALEPLPDWWPDEPVFHGTNRDAWSAIQKDGLCAPIAQNASGDDYGWNEVWRREIHASYKALSKEQRRLLHRHVGHPPGRPMNMLDLGENVSLWWVSKQRRVAEGYSIVTQVDLSVLDYYWWLPDEVLGDESYVFVLPTDCPQAPPRLLERIAFESVPGQWAYHSLRRWAGGPLDIEVALEPPNTDLPLLPGETHFYATAGDAYREYGGPIGRFPWPAHARLLDARSNVWAVEGEIVPDATWSWHDDRYVPLDDPSKFQPMSAWRSR
jgi:hypothetical protein